MADFPDQVTGPKRVQIAGKQRLHSRLAVLLSDVIAMHGLMINRGEA